MDWVKAITFDFWGTLVDVDKSGTDGMRRVLERVGLADLNAAEMYLHWDDATVRRYRSDLWRPYLDWGTMGLRDVLEPRDVNLADGEWTELGELLISTMTAEAKPHPEVPAIISELKSRYPLMPITNMDDRLFDLNPYRATFDTVLTAQEAGAFKPSATIFQEAIKRLNVAPESILHVSLAQFADLEGAMPVGMRVCWINRSRDDLGRFTPVPLYEFPDLKGLGDLFGISA
ncbi:MAG: HAD hydrolase-like protein [Silicimonas sp.]